MLAFACEVHSMVHPFCAVDFCESAVSPARTARRRAGSVSLSSLAGTSAASDIGAKLEWKRWNFAVGDAAAGKLESRYGATRNLWTQSRPANEAPIHHHSQHPELHRRC